MSGQGGGMAYGDAFMAAPAQPLIFPSYLEYMGKSPSYHASLFARAPWFHHAAFRNSDLVWAYVRETNSELPGRIPISCVQAKGWRLHGAIPQEWAKLHAPNMPYGGFERYVQLVHSRMYRTPSRVVVPENLRMDLGRYRFDREIPYADELSRAILLPAWETKQLQVHQEALLLGPQLPAEFRYLRKVADDRRYWDLIRWERSARDRLGVIVPFMNVEVDMVKREYLRELYLEIPPDWAEVETCSGFLVPMSPVVSYCMTELKSPGISGLWTVMYTEYVAITAAMWLWELYDTHRMWFLSTKTRQLMGELDLRKVLGGAENEQEFREMLQIAAELNWDDPTVCPPENRKYQVHRMGYSPGRRHESCGDWVWFNPRARVPVTAEEAAHLRNNIPSMPRGHPQGYRLIDGPPVEREVVRVGEDVMEDEVLEEDEAVGASGSGVTNAGSSAVNDAAATSQPEENAEKTAKESGSDEATQVILKDLLSECGVPLSDLQVPLPELRERLRAIVASSKQGSASGSGKTTESNPKPTE